MRVPAEIPISQLDLEAGGAGCGPRVIQREMVLLRSQGWVGLDDLEGPFQAL